MPNNKKKKGGAKAKGGAGRSNAANRDNLTGLDEMLSNPEEMAAAQREAVESGTGYKPRTGKENAQIGLKGFTQATQNPGMFTDAMSMLSDPSAVKEAEAMMNDPEFKSEISQYMETLKNNSAFREAMAEAQRKYQALLSDPAKMKEATDKYNAMMKAQQEAAVKAQGTGSAAPVAEGGANGGKDAIGTKDIRLDDDGEPLGPEAEGVEEGDDEDRVENTKTGAGKAVPPPEETTAQIKEAQAAVGGDA